MVRWEPGPDASPISPPRADLARTITGGGAGGPFILVFISGLLADHTSPCFAPPPPVPGLSPLCYAWLLGIFPPFATRKKKKQR